MINSTNPGTTSGGSSSLRRPAPSSPVLGGIFLSHRQHHHWDPAKWGLERVGLIVATADAAQAWRQYIDIEETIEQILSMSDEEIMASMTSDDLAGIVATRAMIERILMDRQP